ncbi:hypothetical protein E2C01_041657 [Portunus trituberculatus]|uniref:Uncharacterized protein n=1 Tax=Portunus trituberculatus TaxID=210409 RepID=A0A5B7FQY2_PORTR|nr:hypothetical protein [Portunus trituberculatus]
MCHSTEWVKPIQQKHLGSHGNVCVFTEPRRGEVGRDGVGLGEARRGSPQWVTGNRGLVI